MKPIKGSVTKILGVLCALLLFVPGTWAKTKHTAHRSAKSPSHHAASHGARTVKTSSHGKSGKHSKKTSKSAKVRGQAGIDSDRTREIQEALIRAHYLSGEPSGVWDAETKAAMTKFQSANGWQTKVLPDSRALIKLGLGPSNTGLLNPESAAVSSPHELGAEKEIPGGSIPHR